ncbi:class I SAM-dependent methyltransferase [soil metagenome]
MHTFVQPAAVATTESDSVRRASAFFCRLLPEPRAFDLRFWNGTVAPGTPGSGLTVVINSPGSLRRMFRPPIDLSLGEAYLRGDFDLEGDVWRAGPALATSRGALVSPREVLSLAKLWLDLPKDSDRKDHDGDGRYGSRPAKLEAAQNSRDWDREGIRYHYDAGNDFFAIFLDEQMVYSCAYYRTPDDTLEEAQERKLEHICRKLRLKEGESFLDIGCGWGALMIHAVSRYGVRALGVTLSEQQHDLAKRRIADAGLQDRAEVRLMDYREVDATGFDKIASVGMFEHVGRKRLPEYFDHVYRILRPGGLFLNHAIAGRPRGSTWMRAAIRSALEPILIGSTNFRKRYVFPSGGLVPVSETNLVAQRSGFEVRDVENLREHYMLTLREWSRRLDARREDAIRFGGERMYRLWRVYMGVASGQFERGEFDLSQSLLLRPASRPSGLPLTREDLYR